MENRKKFNFRLLLVLFTCLVLLLILTLLAFRGRNENNIEITPSPTPGITETPEPTPTEFIPSSEIPTFEQTEILTGLSNPWDMIMFDDETFVFTERNNKIKYVQGSEVTPLSAPADTYVRGEGGMLGLALDPDFENNKFIYVCFNSNLSGNVDVRVVRFVFDKETKTLSERKELITGMPSIASGRHSGCQLEFGPDGYLWVGTGDAATSSNPQSKTNLGGKILRVDRDGNAAPGNLEDGFDKRIYSYGHRNVQGLGFFDENAGFEVGGISIEQGSGIDDELNTLESGNYGWDPNPPYSEGGVPMTDKTKFPNAIDAIWSSGGFTEATSGGSVIQGEKWKAWNQAVAVAVQKNTKVMIFELNKDMSVKRQSTILDNVLGRIRTVVMGTDGYIYVLTDNGNASDKIIRLSPK